VACWQRETDLWCFLNDPEGAAEWLVEEIGIMASYELANTLHNAAEAADEAASIDLADEAKAKDDSVT
jgi:hypothetical protein